jgi:selenocysteine lyase/cysteine desulfurase
MMLLLSCCMQDLLHAQHSIEVPVKCIQNTLYVRISAHIYNTLQDYQKLAEAVQQLCSNGWR